MDRKDVLVSNSNESSEKKQNIFWDSKSMCAGIVYNLIL